MLLMPFRFGCSATVLLFLFILSLFIFRLFFRGLLFGRISAMLLMRLRLSRGAAMLLRCALVLTLRFPLFNPFVLTRMGLL